MNCLKFYFDQIVQEANFCSFIFFIVFNVSFMNLTLSNRFIVLLVFRIVLLVFCKDFIFSRKWKWNVTIKDREIYQDFYYRSANRISFYIILLHGKQPFF